MIPSLDRCSSSTYGPPLACCDDRFVIADKEVAVLAPASDIQRGVCQGELVPAVPIDLRDYPGERRAAKYQSSVRPGHCCTGINFALNPRARVIEICQLLPRHEIDARACISGSTGHPHRPFGECHRDTIDFVVHLEASAQVGKKARTRFHSERPFGIVRHGKERASRA